MNSGSDASYYAELQAGAAFLAESAGDPLERAEHLRMAEVYRRRLLDAMPRR